MKRCHAVTATPFQLASTALYWALVAPYRSVAALRVAARASLYVVVAVMYFVSAVYQIFAAASRPIR